MKTVYKPEDGSTTINGHQMEWTMTRSKGESAFGIRGSRIFQLKMKRDGMVSLEYERGWIKKIRNDDEESALCLEYLIKSFGHERKKSKGDKWDE